MPKLRLRPTVKPGDEAQWIREAAGLINGTQTTGVPRYFAATLASGAASYNVDHGLGTRDVMVVVYENSGNYESVNVVVRRPTVDRVTVAFAAATAIDYRVVVIG